MANTFFYNTLIDAVKNLADTAENQISYIESLGLAPMTDELALEFDDMFVLLDAFVSEGYILPDSAPILRELDAKLAAISGKEKYWDFEALRHAAEWQEIRILAQKALDVLCIRDK